MAQRSIRGVADRIAIDNATIKVKERELDEETITELYFHTLDGAQWIFILNEHGATAFETAISEAIKSVDR